MHPPTPKIRTNEIQQPINDFPCDQEQYTNVSVLNIVLEVLVRESRQENETKGTQLEGRKFTNELTLYIENPKNPLKMISTNKKQ